MRARVEKLDVLVWNKSHTLAPLPKLCATKVNFKWTDVENGTFIDMNKIVGHDVLLSYRTFSEIFKINTDTSKTYLRGVISLNG